MSQDLLARIEALYSELPSVDCQSCGYCCVSPSCTLSEFIHFMRYCIDNLSGDDLRKRITAAPVIHADHEGNLRCQFQEGKHCGVHPGRTGACRLFGMPSVERLEITDLVRCPHGARIVNGRDDDEFVRSWLDRLAALDGEFYAFDAEPYFVRGFNLECWIDIYYDESLDFDVFGDIRRVLHQYLDLATYAPAYRFRTGLREKIDKITILSTILGAAPAGDLRKLLTSIRDDYPLTGTYFHEEAEAFLREIASADQTPA